MAVALEPGSIFASDYRIVRPLDAGGMGSIFVAEQLSTGNQRALKLMLPQLVADRGLRDRFLQEARVGARIASDHVVQVIGAGVEPTQNVPWLAMELLSGEELDKRVKREGPLPPREVAEIVKQLGHALSAAHAVGVVHRDLKPSNIFLCRPRVAGAPFLLKVLDFGIAKIVAEAQTTGTSGMGTPLWMAPEQTEARSHVGPGTDIWALGLLVYWMLTGQIYWRSASSGNTSVHAVLREMLMEPIVAPSARAAEQGRAALVPPGFDAWFLAAMERSLDRRYAAVDRAVADLLAILEHAGARSATGPVAASRPAQGYAAPDGGADRGNVAAASWTAAPAGSPPTTPSAAAAGLSAPGFAATAVPAKRSGGVVVAVVAVALLALAVIGGAVAYFVHEDRPRRAHASRGDDDDDDEPVKKKSRSSDDDAEPPSKIDQCKLVIATLNQAKNQLEVTSKLTNPSIEDVKNIADAFDGVAKSISALPIEDAELKGHVADYSAMTRDAATACRAMANALEVGNRPAAIKYKNELDAAAAREPGVVSAINTYCGATAP